MNGSRSVWRSGKAPAVARKASTCSTAGRNSGRGTTPTTRARRGKLRSEEITVGTLFHMADEADPSWRDGSDLSQDERINAQIAELARYSGIDYELKLKEAAKHIGVPKAAVHQEVEKLRATKASAAPPPPTLDELAGLVGDHCEQGRPGAVCQGVCQAGGGRHRDRQDTLSEWDHAAVREGEPYGGQGDVRHRQSCSERVS